MMSTSPCSSANLADEILYGDGNQINATSSYLNISSPQIEISSTHQSQTLKHFLAQKYAAESTSDGDTETHLPNQSFPNTISNFYPFSPLVSSSSHFDSRNILTDGVLESSIDSLQVESSTNEQQQVSGHSANHSNIFNDGLAPIENFIKQEINLSPNSTPNVTSSSNRPATSESNLCLAPSSLFDTVNSDITVDSTTTINISQPSANNINNNNSSLPQLSFNNFPSPLNQSTSSSLPSVLSYGLSPNPFSNPLLQIDHNHQQMIPSLISPTSIQIDHYFNQSNGLEKKEEHVILDQAQQLIPASIHSYSNENCLISDNSLSENLFHDISNEHYTETEITNLIKTENVINDLPVLTRARASLPIDYLYLHESGNGLGVFARKTIPKRTQFGPIEGVIASLPDSQYSPNNIAYSYKNSLIIFISGNFLLSQADENNSNWTRFVRPANNLNEQNLELITKEFNPMNEVKFYFYTTRNIMPNEELKVWYCNEYAQTFNIKPLEESELALLNENESTNKKDLASATSNVTTGHKLRNKIAKTQMVQNLLSDGSNKLVEQQTLNESQISDLFSSNIQMISTGSVLNGNLIRENEKTSHTIISINSNDSNKLNDNSKTNINENEKPKYQCDKCQKIFPRHYSLRRHLVMHSGEKRYKCPICGMAFNHVYNRNRHIKMHKIHLTEGNANKIEEGNQNSVKSPVKNEEVLVFNKLIDSSDQLNKSQENIQINNTIKPIQVEKSMDSNDSNSKSENIKIEIVTSSGLEKNTSKQANNNKSSAPEKLFRCSQCYKRFSTKERLEKHGIVHDESAKKLSCDVCDRKFLTNSALSCHVKYHQFSADEPRKYDCTLCDKVFDNIQLRREHVAVHINPDTGLFHCPKCPKTFEDFSIIRKHLKSFHSNEIFPCSQCPKVFPRQDKLRLHMLCHIDRWEFKCNFCEKQFKRKDKLKEHTQRMHAPDRDVRIAAKIAARMQRLKVQRTKKVATKPSQPNYHEYVYKCHKCLFGFKRRGMLVNHLAKRHPEIPYNSVPELNLPIVKTSKDYYCQYCEKVYKSSSKRKAHIIKNHPGKSLPPSNRNKTVTSDVVNQSFSATVGSITINPHFCDWCHKQYASKAKLMQHQRKKHPDKISNSSNTKQKTNSSIGDGITTTTNSTNTNTNMYKLNTVITSDKAAFTTIPIKSETETIKSEINSDQIISVDHSKIDHFLSDDSPSYIDSFNISNHYAKDNGIFLNGTSVQVQEQPVHYTIDSSNPSFEDLMNINIGPDVNHNLNSINNSTNSNSFTNNIITILGTTTFTNDLSEFSDIITQISDFQNGKQSVLSTNPSVGISESSSTDLLISGTIEENNWNQVCEEMAIV